MKKTNSTDSPSERRVSREKQLRIANDFQRGTAEAVQAVRQRVQKILAARGYRMPADDKKDLEQEIMTQVWQAANRSSFEAGDRFWGFVEVLTARRCIDWLRSRYRDSRIAPLEHDVEEASTGPLGEALELERSELAHRALARLAKPCRDLIYLHFGLEKSYRELAALLGKSEGALRVQMFRCVKRAREVLGQLTTESTNRGNSRVEHN